MHELLDSFPSSSPVESGTGGNKPPLPHSVYTGTDFFLLRAPVLSATTYFEAMATPSLSCLGNDTAATDALIEQWASACYHQLRELAERPDIQLAITVASPSLAGELSRASSKGGPRQKELHLYSRLLRYITRMSTRPTPFGLFAGVALGTFGQQTHLRLGLPPTRQTRTRPDMSWVLSLVQQVEQSKDVVFQLRVRTNQTLSQVGDRVILPQADTYGKGDDRSISLRATPVVRAVLELARRPIRYADLREGILSAFPEATVPQVEHVLWKLWEHHFLISDLHPPLTTAEPAQYVLEQLRTISGCEHYSAELHTILEASRNFDTTRPQEALHLLRDMARRQEQLVQGDDARHIPLQIDTALQIDGATLTSDVNECVAQAAETLLRLSRFPWGLTHLQEYRMAFLERYGSEAEVSLLDLLGPEIGLDAPTGYAQPPRSYPLPQRPSLSHQSPAGRDLVLCELVARASHLHSEEVELTNDLIEQIAGGKISLDDAPSSVEIYAQLHASSVEAIDRGEWRIVISPAAGASAGGRTFGRFFDLLGERGMAALKHFYQQEEALWPDALFAELSYVPRQGRAANVALRPLLRSYEIAIGTTPSVPADHVISLADLVVGVKNNRFYLRSLSHGAYVVVCQSHMLNVLTAPNACRFLIEISMDGRPWLMPFDWGAASTSPFLPRLVRGQAVIAPAQWNLSPSQVIPIGHGSDDVQWFQGLQQWRAAWRVPRHVYWASGDNRLLLDLEHPVSAAEVRSELAKAGARGRVVLQEVYPGREHLWLRDREGSPYFSELVVPVVRRQASKTPPVLPSSRRSAASITTRERSQFPGDDWVYLKLYAATSRHEELLAGAVPELVHDLHERNLIDRWFFLRYVDPEPHLRIRFHARERSPREGASVLMALYPWSKSLAEREVIQRVSFDTYLREIERYGGPAAISCMEEVFSLDSAVSCRIIANHSSRLITLDTLATAVLSLDHFFASWGLDREQRHRWVQEHTPSFDGRKAYRSQRRLYCELLAPWALSSDQELAKERDLLLSVLDLWKPGLGDAAQNVQTLVGKGELWVPEHEILGSLAHMHLNRLLGLDRALEMQAYAFWSYTLESIDRRPTTRRRER